MRFKNVDSRRIGFASEITCKSKAPARTVGVLSHAVPSRLGNLSMRLCYQTGADSYLCYWMEVVTSQRSCSACSRIPGVIGSNHDTPQQQEKIHKQVLIEFAVDKGRGAQQGYLEVCLVGTRLANLALDRPSRKSSIGEWLRETGGRGPAAAATQARTFRARATP